MDAQTKKISRRRFLSVCAMAGVVSAMPWANALSAVPLHRWNGILLGADVSLSLAHPDHKEVNRIFERCVGEIKRLENIFTLYDSHSELSQLNADEILKMPSSDMVNILEQARLYHDMTNGAFDVTVKPLEEGKPVSLVGMDKLHVSPKEIRFEKPEMGVTLNGIAQGYITDRITEFLKTEGLQNVLVELGEKRTIGGHPSGRPWYLALQGHEEPVSMFDNALATSAARNAGVGKQHIYSPINGQHAEEHDFVSVLANNATMADALSTGFMSLNREQINAVRAKNQGVLAVYF